MVASLGSARSTTCHSQAVARSHRRFGGGVPSSMGHFSKERVSMTTMSASEIELVTLDDIETAARGLAGVATRTPLLPFDALSERVNVTVYVKPEMLQRGGAFK